MNTFQKGTKYEKYVYSIINSSYDYCWLWGEIKLTNVYHIDEKLKLFMDKNNKICDDIGCDILGVDSYGKFYFIQCKDYSLINSIKVEDFAGFYKFCAENIFGQPIVYYSGKLSWQITKYNTRIKYINIPSEFTILNKIDIIPRDYQIDAYNKLKDSDVGVIDMPCGMGKTIISYLLSIDYDNTVILTPKITTCNQVVAHYKKYYGIYSYHKLS